MPLIKPYSDYVPRVLKEEQEKAKANREIKKQKRIQQETERLNAFAYDQLAKRVKKDLNDYPQLTDIECAMILRIFCRIRVKPKLCQEIFDCEPHELMNEFQTLQSKMQHFLQRLGLDDLPPHNYKHNVEYK